MLNAKYIMVKLSQADHDALADAVEGQFGGSSLYDYKKVFCDHMTLAYGPDQVGAFDESLLGKEVVIHGTEVIYNERCAALRIAKEDAAALGCNNENPHVTLATDGETKPVYSNDLIKNHLVMMASRQVGKTGAFLDYMKGHPDVVSPTYSMPADVTLHGTVEAFKGGNKNVGKPA